MPMTCPFRCSGSSLGKISSVYNGEGKQVAATSTVSICFATTCAVQMSCRCRATGNCGPLRAEEQVANPPHLQHSCRPFVRYISRKTKRTCFITAKHIKIWAVVVETDALTRRGVANVKKTVNMKTLLDYPKETVSRVALTLVSNACTGRIKTGRTSGGSYVGRCRLVRVNSATTTQAYFCTADGTRASEESAWRSTCVFTAHFPRVPTASVINVRRTRVSVAGGAIKKPGPRICKTHT